MSAMGGQSTHFLILLSLTSPQHPWWDVLNRRGLSRHEPVFKGSTAHSLNHSSTIQRHWKRMRRGHSLPFWAAQGKCTVLSPSTAPLLVITLSELTYSVMCQWQVGTLFQRTFPNTKPKDSAQFSCAIVLCWARHWGSCCWRFGVTLYHN